MQSKQKPSLGPELYDHEYYQKSLPGREYLEQDKIDPAILETIRLASIKSTDRVLDFGCGRGNLVIEMAKRGCDSVGVDFSGNAIEFARSYSENFPVEIRNRIQFFQSTMNDLKFNQEFDLVVFNQVYEHLHDWELEILLQKFKNALKPNGRLVISTPNLNYIRYLYPLKRILEFPFKLVKESLRVLRGKSKHAASFNTFLKEIFKIKYPESEHTQLHINLQTPSSIQKFLTKHGFLAKVECVDYHSNLISRLTERWWGETIWVLCELRNSF